MITDPPPTNFTREREREGFEREGGGREGAGKWPSTDDPTFPVYPAVPGREKE